MNKTLRGVLCTLIGAICWGFCGTCSEFLFTYKDWDPNFLSPIRMFLAGLILFLFSLTKEKGKTFAVLKSKKGLFSLVAFALAGVMVSQYTYLTTISHSNSGTATILQYTGLAMILIWVCLKDRRWPRFYDALAILCAFFGIFLIATHGDIHTLVISKECLFWGLFSAVGLACYSVIPAKILKQYSSTSITGFAMLLGGIILIVLLRPWQYQMPFDPASFVAFLGVLLIGTVLAYNLYLLGVAYIGPVRAGMISAIEPVAAAMFTALWLGSTFTWIDCIGFALIISTVFISNIPKKEVKIQTDVQPSA